VCVCVCACVRVRARARARVRVRVRVVRVRVRVLIFICFCGCFGRVYIYFGCVLLWVGQYQPTFKPQIPSHLWRARLAVAS
jgi:hypothetical protein